MEQYQMCKEELNSIQYSIDKKEHIKLDSQQVTAITIKKRLLHALQSQISDTEKVLNYTEEQYKAWCNLVKEQRCSFQPYGYSRK